MYDIFHLPEDFLTRKYSEKEKNEFDQQIHNFVQGRTQQLTEDLTEKQKKKVDRWYGPNFGVTEDHDKVFGKSVDRIYLPYDTSKDEPTTSENYHSVPEMRNMPGIPIHHTILNALTSKGYKVDDYSTGLTYHQDEPKRKLKITAALQKIGIADQQTMGHRSKDGNPLTYAQAYAADPVRAAAKKDKQIVITRNPYDVAGMSTNRGWTSCMNLEQGSNRHYVKHDIAQGTLTAYLCTKDDDGIHRPIGRINLKRFEHLSSRHAIYRPEDAHYGSIPTSFPQRVHEWAQQNYPEKDAGIYMKHVDLYNDDGKNVHTHKLHELDPESALHKHTEDAVHRAVSELYEKPYDEKGFHDYGDNHDEVNTVMSKYHQQLTDKQHAHSVIHWTADHSYNSDGEQPKSLYDVHFTPRHSDEMLHAFATDAVGTSRVKKGIAEFTPHDSMIALDKIHAAIKGSEDEEHQHLKDVHGDLIDHIYKQQSAEWTPVKEHIVDHMLEDKNRDYYVNHRDYNVMENTSQHMRKHYLPEMSTQPRKIQRLLDLESEHTDMQALGEARPVEHIARHADAKLAHHVLLEHPDADLNREHFAKSLNENPNGEHIQHTLLDPMYFSGSHDEDYEAAHHDSIAYLAKHTKHRSVFDRIKSRATQDLAHEPFIKKALNSNTHFGQSQHMEHYLRWL